MKTKTIKLFFIIISILIISLTNIYADGKRGIKPRSTEGEIVKGDQWLFVIGINKYKYWPMLTTAVNDAQSVSGVHPETDSTFISN